MSFDANSATGKVDNGLELNGSSDYVSRTSTNALQITEALTISGWVKGNAWGSGLDVDLILRKGENDPNNYQLAVADGTPAFFLDENDDQGIRGNTSLQTDQWYHLAATWDGTQVRIYVNGVLDNTPASFTGPLNTDTRPLCIGGRASGDWFDGILDDIRLYNRAITPEEVLHLHSAGLTGLRIIKWVEVP